MIMVMSAPRGSSGNRPPAALDHARVRHVNAVANGPNTQYDFSISEGFCQPDDQGRDNGDNGPGDAPTALTNGANPNNIISVPIRWT